MEPCNEDIKKRNPQAKRKGNLTGYFYLYFYEMAYEFSQPNSSDKMQIEVE